MDELLIVADLGKLKAYRIVKDPLKLASDKLEMIQEVISKELHAKAADKFSDAAGRFYHGGGAAGRAIGGSGEPHAIEAEEERRAIKHLAAEISALVQKEGCKTWHMAVDKNINNQVFALLAPDVKTRLDKNISANLTKIDKAKLAQQLRSSV